MAKKKINTLRGKRLVTGDPNLITMNEIHVKDTSKGVEVTERDKNGKLVNVNVPQSGGGNGGGGMELISLENVSFPNEQVRYMLIKTSYAIKYLYEHNGKKLITQTALYNKPENATVYAIATDFSFITGEEGNMASLKEVFMALLNYDTDSLPRITEEEFYNLG